MEWYKIVGLVIILLFLQFINNLYKFKRTKFLYYQYLDSKITGDMEFIQKKQEVISLFKDAGLKDFAFIHQEFLAYGQHSTMTVSGFDNMNSDRLDVFNHMKTRFNEAIGVYRKRFMDSFNPMFWIDFVFKFPQYLFEFFGVLPEKVIVKIFLILYWLMLLIFGLKNTDIIERLFKFTIY